MNNEKPKLGDIYLMNFSGIGSEQKGVRPGIVFQNNIGNDRSPNVIALPLTTRIKNLSQPTHVLLPAEKYSLVADSLVLCENPQRMSKERLSKYLGSLKEDDMKSVAIGSIVSSAAVSLLSKEELLEAWQTSKKIQGM